MSWFKKEPEAPTPFWVATDQMRWHPCKIQGDYILEVQQIQDVDMNSGETRWRQPSIGAREFQLRHGDRVVNRWFG